MQTNFPDIITQHENGKFLSILDERIHFTNIEFEKQVHLIEI